MPRWEPQPEELADFKAGYRTFLEGATELDGDLLRILALALAPPAERLGNVPWVAGWRVWGRTDVIDALVPLGEMDLKDYLAQHEPTKHDADVVRGLADAAQSLSLA